jgi:predicted nucleic acid-binding protein
LTWRPAICVEPPSLSSATANLPLDASDACTVALAERLGITEVITIDNDFRVVRPAHVEAFVITP